jgi:protein transport protein SEC31
MKKYFNTKDGRENIVRLLGFSKEELADKLAALKLADTLKSPRTEMVSSIVKDVIDTTLESKADADPAQTGDGVSSLFTGTGENDFTVSQGTALISASSPSSPFMLYPDSDKESLDAMITKCIVLGNFAGAVKLCLANDRLDDALMLAVCGGPELLEQTKDEFFARKKGTRSYLRVVSSVMNQDLQDIVKNADIVVCWRDILAILCTYAAPEDFAGLANTLADRLREESDQIKDAQKKGSLLDAAVLVYISAANFEKVVMIWIEQHQAGLHSFVQKLDKTHVSLYSTHEYATSLQSLIEKVTVFRNSINYVDEANQESPLQMENQMTLKSLYKKYAIYGGMLVNQGLLKDALRVLNLTNGYKIFAGTGNRTNSVLNSPISPTFQSNPAVFDLIAVYKHRIYTALKKKDVAQFKHAPTVPFEVASVPDAVSYKSDFLQSAPVEKKLPEKPAVQAPTQPAQPAQPNYAYPGSGGYQPAAQPNAGPAYPNYTPNYGTPTYPNTGTYGQPAYPAPNNPYNPSVSQYGQPAFQQPSTMPPSQPPVGPPPMTQPVARPNFVPPPPRIATPTGPSGIVSPTKAPNQGPFYNDPPIDSVKTNLVKQSSLHQQAITNPFPNQPPVYGQPQQPPQQQQPLGPPTGPMMAAPPGGVQPQQVPAGSYPPQQPGVPQGGAPAYWGSPVNQPAPLPTEPEKSRHRMFAVKLLL